MASLNSATSSSSRPRRGWTYDVFLSFRGEDTRNNFVDHLYAALVQKGIHTFKDDQMIHGGNPISPELEKAIEESRFAVVVFSENYASSSWCLEELVKITESKRQMGLRMLPVFYHVDPSDVRKQKGSFASAFQEHELNFNGEKNQVNKWREALAAAASLSGYHISAVSGGEYATIIKIVEEILGNMRPRLRENDLIGIESHMDALNSLLNIEEMHKVCILGIFGMGGIGKTTIARALFRRIAYKFEGSSFINDVRENSVSKRDICALQEKILSDILVTHHTFLIDDPEDGANLIQERFCNKQVLLVLDNVDDVKQLEFLCAKHEWFGSGSRIIITTRDEHLLSDANFKYKPHLLRMDQAIELFSMQAFRKTSPPDGYKELSNRAVSYTGRLPLALKVLGSFFRGRKVDVWESALDRLAKTPNTEIFETLMLSFDGLEEFEKKIFLDIACFFKDGELNYVTRVLDSFGFFARIGITSLMEKSLITISKNRLDMHDLIQEMGWKIVNASAPNSRLWKQEEIRDFIKKSQNFELIEAIVFRSEDDAHPNEGFRADVFKKMKNLRFLDIDDKFTSLKPTILPYELRWLCWNDYLFSFLPIANMSKLVGLEIRFGKMEYLWKGHKILPNMKFIKLHALDFLTRLPDVSGAPNIERLILSNCENLVEVDESLGFLKKLVYLDMSKCQNLKHLPSKIEMESLETLILLFCTSLERFPEISPCVIKLSHIDLGFCYGIQELPSSIRYLCNLRTLNLEHCTSLGNIPDSFFELKRLKSLCLHGCSKLRKFLDEFRSMEKLQELYLQRLKCIDFGALPNLHALRKLDLSWNQIEDQDFPKNLNGFSSLEELYLTGNSKLIRLPASISHLSHLKRLDLSECQKLERLHGLPLGIHVLDASNCISLEIIKDLTEEYTWLHKIRLFGCKKLLENEDNERYLDKMLRHSYLKTWASVDCGLSIGIPGSKIPTWFKQKQYGYQIALKLHHKWQTQITGFAICVVIREIKRNFPLNIILRFENDGIFAPMVGAENINAPEATKDGNVWINYIPFSSFEQIHDDYNDLRLEDWSHITQGNLVIHIRAIDQDVVKCGAQLVYKEDLESIQKFEPSTSSYWNWEIKHWYHNTLWCE